MAGQDKVVGSWLLFAEFLTTDAMRDALIDFQGEFNGARLYMVAEKGVHDVVPRGGSDAVNPAWRKALIQTGKSRYRRTTRLEILTFITVTSQAWIPLNEIERAIPNITSTKSRPKLYED